MEERDVREPGELVAGLDIGTTKVCALIGEVFDDRVEIVGVGTASSSGMKKGRGGQYRIHGQIDPSGRRGRL